MSATRKSQIKRAYSNKGVVGRNTSVRKSQNQIMPQGLYFTNIHNSHTTLNSHPNSATTAISHQDNSERNLSGIQQQSFSPVIIDQNQVMWAQHNQQLLELQQQRQFMKTAAASSNQISITQQQQPGQNQKQQYQTHHQNLQNVQQITNQTSAFSQYKKSLSSNNNNNNNHQSADNIAHIDQEIQQKFINKQRKLRVKTAKKRNHIDTKLIRTQQYITYEPRILSKKRKSIDSQTNIDQMQYFGEPYTGPGDYNHENITGNNQIITSTIQSQPKYSFSKSIRPEFDLNKSQIIQNIKRINSFSNKNSTASYLNKSVNCTIVTPGVGDYEIEKEVARQRSPVCTIGKQDRFKRLSSQQRYKPNLPASYVSNLDERQKPKISLGIIDKQHRFKNHGSVSPGPGDYDLTGFKSLSKGEHSILNGQYNTTSSPRLMNTLSPFSMSKNTLNHTSRQQYEKLYHREYDKALLNQTGPGPSYYKHEKFNQSFTADQHKYSIPKVNPIFQFNLYQDDRRIMLQEWDAKHKTPIQYSNIQKEINLLLRSSQSIKIPQFRKKFDPRKSNIFYI
ncbi:UNKNOWN [Stylonychia lemnae]|uniref:Uncharacterized protein n=1 Tax=Stylonychia lemnae TaxID=5949 RepID=A0A078AM81_STYLE|nr:UNKNOWN [Stylonychia lemnae]|eukprot:CDW82492.1 UNKNOWN [Stylonychia lemnae]